MFKKQFNSYSVNIPFHVLDEESRTKLISLIRADINAEYNKSNTKLSEMPTTQEHSNSSISYSWTGDMPTRPEYQVW